MLVQIQPNIYCEPCKVCGSRPVIQQFAKEKFKIICPKDADHYKSRAGKITIESWNNANSTGKTTINQTRADNPVSPLKKISLVEEHANNQIAPNQSAALYNTDSISIDKLIIEKWTFHKKDENVYLRGSWTFYGKTNPQVNSILSHMN